MSIDRTREIIAEINVLVDQLDEEQLKQLAAYATRRIEELKQERALAEKLIHVFQDLRAEGALPTVEVPDNPTAVEDYPAWDPAATYVTGDLVSHEGRVWQSARPGRNTATPGEGRAWVDVTDGSIATVEDGVPTPPVAGDAPEGWQPGVDYTEGTRVMYGGVIYRVLRDLTSENTPEFAPDDYAKEGEAPKDKSK